MAKKFSIYWYKEGPEFTRAFLYNRRDNDVHEGRGIPKEAILQGSIGFVAAESEVYGWSAKVAHFAANRRCMWQDFELPCMTAAALPGGKVSGSVLRNWNYAVAAITSDQVKALADSPKCSGGEDPGRRLGNKRGTGAV